AGPTGHRGTSRGRRRSSHRSVRAVRRDLLYGRAPKEPSLTMSRPALALLACASVLTLTACARTSGPVAAAPDVDWPFYGGDAGGQRYSTAEQITPANVRDLKVAWTYSTGEMAKHPKDILRASFENTPILAGGRLYVCSQFDAVHAL